MLGRYMSFAILALGLGLLWGYVGILSLCQFTFFCLGAYAMGMHLAHHGGPEGIIDANGWKIPACLFLAILMMWGSPLGMLLSPVLEPFWNHPSHFNPWSFDSRANRFSVGLFCFPQPGEGSLFCHNNPSNSSCGLVSFLPKRCDALWNQRIDSF